MTSELLAGRYELRDTIGHGATGRVWQGYDTFLHRIVAVKLVELEGAKDAMMGERFRREGIAIAGIHDPGVVQVFDAGTDDARGWLVMELLSGPNLSQLVTEAGPVEPEIGMRILAKVARGLRAAHVTGITHRDVKPANIVLNAKPDAEGTKPDLVEHPELGQPVLVDFGIARIVDEGGINLTKPATAIGTAAYMSPEQARGRECNSASDVYSLACVAYFLLAGRPPFTGTTSLAVAHSQAFDTPPALSEFDPATPPALDALLLRMLSKEPDERPTASQVAEELEAIADDPDLPPTSGQTVAISRAEPEEPRRHVVPWIIGAVILALVAALAWSWVSRPGEPEPSPTPTVTLTKTQSPTTHTTTVEAPPPAQQTTQAPENPSYEPEPTEAPVTSTQPTEEPPAQTTSQPPAEPTEVPTTAASPGSEAT